MLRAPRIAVAVATLALFVCSGCSIVLSWHRRGEAPEVHVVQVTPIVESEAAVGPVDIEYELFVRNPLSEPLELTAVDMRTAGIGAYIMRNQHVDLRGLVPPGRTRVIRFVTRAWYRGGRFPWRNRCASKASPVSSRRPEFVTARSKR
jgi:hypothetical protein